MQTPENDLPDNDELFDAYVTNLLYAEQNGGFSLFADYGKDRLKGPELSLYNKLRAEVEKIANGTRSNTQFDMSGIWFKWTFKELGIQADSTENEIVNRIWAKYAESINSVMSYTLMDCPYEVYWFDKTIGWLYGINDLKSDGTSFSIEAGSLYMAVAKGYEDSGKKHYISEDGDVDMAVYVDSSKVISAKAAISKAKSIVKQYADLPDYEKLKAYKDEICGLVEYNFDAVEDPTTAYGDPWQLIWVFDGDPATDVVCEGYSKAFQYLCDLSDFENPDTRCYTVTGEMDGGAHMWNIVTLEGKNYLVDVTNCDPLSEYGQEYTDILFLKAPIAGSVEYGYILAYGNEGIEYVYDQDTFDSFEKTVLTLAESSYVPKPTAVVKFPQTTQSVTYTGSSAKVLAPTVTVGGNEITGVNITYYYKVKGSSGDYVKGLPVNAGTYMVKAHVGDTDEYRGAYSTNELELTIKKVSPKLTFNGYKQDKVYDGKALSNPTADTLKVTGVDFDEVTYTWHKDSAKDEVLSGAPKDAGTYVLVASVKGNENREAATTESGPITISKRPVTVQVDHKSKTYGEKDPALTYEIVSSISLAEGEKLNGELSREKGEDVKAGGYAIGQGTLTNENNPNYAITFSADVLTITPADYTVTVQAKQNVLQGIGKFIEPVFTGVNGEKVKGTLTYTYNSESKTYEEMKEILSKLDKDTEVMVSYSFKSSDSNYVAEAKTGEIQLAVKDVEFVVGTETATLENAVSIKENPVYGDAWKDIVKINAITAKAGEESDSDASHFTLSVSGKPNARKNLEFKVLYNGTLAGKTYKDVEVCSGFVDVAKKTVTVAAGSYKVSKEYDGTTKAGKSTGKISVNGILSEDADVSVTANPDAYTNPNVGGQKTVEVELALEGNGAENYVLEADQIAVPCEITPKKIKPVVEITGTYTYTGKEITPAFIVKDGDVELEASDYTAVVSDNVNAGTGKVVVTAKDGSNYTWDGEASATFTIAKAEYSGEKAAETTARYGNEANFNLASLLPEGYKLELTDVTDENQILDGEPSVDGSVVAYKLVAEKGKVGHKAVIIVKVMESKNYKPFELTLTITMSDKLAQNLHFESDVVSKTYGDESFTVKALDVAKGSKVTYVSSDPSVATVDQTGKITILKAGTTVITAEAAETADYMAANATCEVVINKKNLAWDVTGLYAVDKEGAIEDAKATLYGELKVMGILEADKAEAVYTCPAEKLVGTYESVKAGTQKVSLAWADSVSPVTLQGAKAENYNLPGELPVINGKIHAVVTDLPELPESNKDVKYKVEVEGGISIVPDALKAIESLNTPAKIDKQMRLDIQKKDAKISSDNIQVYDVTLLVNINGTGWKKADVDNFPEGGLTVTLPYPEGTGEKTHDFVVAHMFAMDMNGHQAGEVEYPAVTKTADGISFKVNGLSPISVGWTKAETTDQKPETTTPDKKDNTSKNPQTGDNALTGRYLILLVLSLGAIVVYGFARRRRRY
ncbi:MBG domain-containing protein [Roseburia hominis]